MKGFVLPDPRLIPLAHLQPGPSPEVGLAMRSDSTLKSRRFYFVHLTRLYMAFPNSAAGFVVVQIESEGPAHDPRLDLDDLPRRIRAHVQSGVLLGAE